MSATPIHDELADALRRRIDDPAPASQDEARSDRSTPGLDDTTRRVVALARDEAEAQGRSRWGTGHLLLGMLRGGEAIADLLGAAGADVGAVRRSVARYEAVSASGSDDDTLGASERPCSLAATRVMAAAEASAREGERDQIGVADLLGALIGSPTGAATGVLAALEVPREELAAAARALAGRPAPQAAGMRWSDPSRLLRRRG